MRCSFFIILAGLLSSTYTQVTDVPDYKDQDTTALLSWKPPPNFETEYPYALSGFDDDNTPIYLIEYGKWDLRRIGERQQEREMKLYMQQMLRRTIEGLQLRSTPEEPVTQLNVIIDMDGYSAQQASSPKAVQLTLWLARNLEQAWRGKLKVGFLLNTNYLFQTVFELMKPLLGPNVYKVDVYGNNRDKWLPAVVKAFPKSEIPEFYGGVKGHKPVVVYG